jgi:hypothetical protein
MRFGEWIQAAPHKDSAGPKVLAVIEPMLTMLGCEADPPCWVSWGDDPGVRYVIFAPTDAGLVQVNVRVNVPGEGPRAGGKLIRWQRVQLGDLAVEMQGGHRILSIPLEGQILRGTDATADLVAAFVLDALDAIDGRPRATRPDASGDAAGGSATVPPAASDVAPVPPRRRPIPQLEAPKGPTP